MRADFKMPLPKSVVCSHCKKTYPEGWKRCPYCGFDATRARSEAQQRRFMQQKLREWEQRTGAPKKRDERGEREIVRGVNICPPADYKPENSDGYCIRCEGFAECSARYLKLHRPAPSTQSTAPAVPELPVPSA